MKFQRCVFLCGLLICGVFLGFVRRSIYKEKTTLSGVQGFALMFLVYDAINHPRVWETWLEDAQESVKQRNSTRFQIELNPYIHMSNTTQMTKFRKGLPNNLKGALIEQKAMAKRCRWGQTMPCMKAVLRQALKSVNNKFFIFTSGSTIPVKSFNHISEDLLANPRSRICWAGADYPFQKHSQWVILNREDAEIVANDESSCFSAKINPLPKSKKDHGLERGFYADDELGIFRPLEREFGRTALVHRLNDGLPFSQTSTGFGCHTYVYWRYKNVSGVPTKKRLPLEFNEVWPDVFKCHMAPEEIWFARKYSSTATVNGSTELFENLVVETFRTNDFFLC